MDWGEGRFFIFYVHSQFVFVAVMFETEMSNVHTCNLFDKKKYLKEINGEENCTMLYHLHKIFNA